MTLDHEAMAKAEYRDRMIWAASAGQTVSWSNPSVLAPYRRNLLASASDPILNDAAMRTLNAFQPLARKVNHARRRR